MKATSKKSFLVLVLLICLSGYSFAGINESKAVVRAREAVEQAAPHDWLTLAKSAEICFRKNENIKEALEWLDRSIEIKEDPYNLEIKGDYLAGNKLPEMAKEYYFKAIVKGKELYPGFDTGSLQQKIWDLR